VSYEVPEADAISMMIKDPRYRKLWPRLMPKMREEIKKRGGGQNPIHKDDSPVSNKPRIQVGEMAEKRRRCGELKSAGLPCNEFNQPPADEPDQKDRTGQ
jgi:hypothetical protein